MPTVEHRLAEDDGEVASGMGLEPGAILKAIFYPNGRVMITADDPRDFEQAWGHIYEVMSALAGDSPIGYFDCMPPEQVKAIAERLATMLLAEEGIT